MPRKVWTPDLLARLRELYPAVGGPETARRLGKSLTSVKDKAQVLGLKGDHRRPRAWTAERDAALRAAYAAGGLPAAREALPQFSSGAIEQRAHKLGAKRPRTWTAEEDAYLRAHYGRDVRAAAIAAHLGRGEPAVRRRANLIGVTSERYWTAEQIAAVKAGYATKGATALAVELLGSGDPQNVQAVYRLAFKHKLTNPVRHPEWVYARVRELHGRGLSDTRIAAAMSDYFVRNAREAVTAIRSRRLGLPKVKTDMRPVLARQRATLGVANPQEIKARAHRRFAVGYGLPEDLAVRQVQIVVRLARGPATIADLRADLGMRSFALNRPKAGSARPDPGVSGTYLSDLCRRGLVFFDQIPSARGGAPLRRYALTPFALTLLSSHKESADDRARTDAPLDQRPARAPEPAGAA